MDTVVFLNPVTGRVEVITTEMIEAYVPHAEHLSFEAAARVAAIRDDEAATNLLDSVQSLLSSGSGDDYNIPPVEPPSLR